MTDQSQVPSPPKDDKKIRDEIALLSFVDRIIKEKNDPMAKQEELPRLKAFLLQQVHDSINRTLIAALPEKDQILLDELLDKNPADGQINEFLIKHIPNIEAEITVALLNFRAAYLYPQGQPKPATTNQTVVKPQTAKMDEDLPAPPAPTSYKGKPN